MHPRKSYERWTRQADDLLCKTNLLNVTRDDDVGDSESWQQLLYEPHILTQFLLATKLN